MTTVFIFTPTTLKVKYLISEIYTCIFSISFAFRDAKAKYFFYNFYLEINSHYIR